MRDLNESIFDVIMRKATGSPIRTPELYPYVTITKPEQATKFDVIPSSVAFPEAPTTATTSVETGQSTCPDCPPTPGPGQGVVLDPNGKPKVVDVLPC